MMTAGHAVRDFLRPLWVRLHAVDLGWRRIEAMPDVPSTALCRQTVLFSLRAFERAGEHGWRPVSGRVHRSAMTAVPGYAEGETFARHCWMGHRAGAWLDLTADQFGLPDVLVGRPTSDPFAGHEQVAEKPPLRALLRTVYNWEGDPRGTWPETDLAHQRERYGALLHNLQGGFGLKGT